MSTANLNPMEKWIVSVLVITNIGGGGGYYFYLVYLHNYQSYDYAITQYPELGLAIYQG
jgi:hypothetical protein